VPGVFVFASAVCHDRHLLKEIASREICKICFHANPVGFHVPDEIWEAAIPERMRGEVICLQCFARLADEKLVAWDGVINFYPVSMATHLSASMGAFTPMIATSPEGRSV
jgi:hypothetical protein